MKGITAMTLITIHNDSIASKHRQHTKCSGRAGFDHKGVVMKMTVCTLFAIFSLQPAFAQEFGSKEAAEAMARSAATNTIPTTLTVKDKSGKDLHYMLVSDHKLPFIDPKDPKHHIENENDERTFEDSKNNHIWADLIGIKIILQLKTIEPRPLFGPPPTGKFKSRVIEVPIDKLSEQEQKSVVQRISVMVLPCEKDKKK